VQAELASIARVLPGRSPIRARNGPLRAVTLIFFSLPRSASPGSHAAHRRERRSKRHGLGEHVSLFGLVGHFWTPRNLLESVLVASSICPHQAQPGLGGHDMATRPVSCVFALHVSATRPHRRWRCGVPNELSVGCQGTANRRRPSHLRRHTCKPGAPRRPLPPLPPWSGANSVEPTNQHPVRPFQNTVLAVGHLRCEQNWPRFASGPLPPFPSEGLRTGNPYAQLSAAESLPPTTMS